MKTLRFVRRYVLAEMLVLLVLFATLARADQEGDFSFDRDGATAVLTGYAGPGGAVVIPDRLGDLPVASIGIYAFYSRTNLTSVTSPNSVTSIGREAFRDCTGLTSITIPNSVTSIEESAFNGCSALMSVTIPNGVTGIDRVTFGGCKALTNVTIPNSVTSIGVGAFSGCAGLTSVTIPNSVTGIGYLAFSDCTGLTSVTIPHSVTDIGGELFSRCTALRAIEVDSLNLAYSSAEGVLFNKTQSALIAYPGGKAGPYTIPNSVTSIQSFRYCTGLTSVTIPNSVTVIGDPTFSGCTGLRAIEVDSLNLFYSSREGVLFNKTQSVLIEYPEGKAGPYTIPSSVTSIGEMAFSGCTGLTGVTIPNSVTSIMSQAFYGCAGLTSVTIPDSVISIGEHAFEACTGLRAIDVDSLNLAYSSAEGVLFNKTQSVLTEYPAGKAGPYTIPTSVTSIGREAFHDCIGLTSVTIPNSVTSIRDSAFSSCTSLTSVTIPQSVRNIGFGAFSGCTGLTSVYCEGNSPGIRGDAFSDSAFVTVFYRAGTVGWNSTYANRPTAVWAPRPAFADWAVSTGLATQFPNASADGDDPDGDGFTNGAEWFAATDPTQRASRLELELTPRTADLAASDQTPIEPGQQAVYLRSVPGRYYGVQRATSLGGAWELQATKVAATTQTRFVLPRPADHGFYRVLALP